MFIVTHCYRLACFYLIYDPRVSTARIQSRATIGPPAKRHSVGVSSTGRQCPGFTCLRKYVHKLLVNRLLLSLTILLEWQLYMYLCILNVRYVLLYTLVRQK